MAEMNQENIKKAIREYLNTNIEERFPQITRENLVGVHVTDVFPNGPCFVYTGRKKYEFNLFLEGFYVNSNGEMILRSFRTTNLLIEVFENEESVGVHIEEKYITLHSI